MPESTKSRPRPNEGLTEWLKSATSSINGSGAGGGHEWQSVVTTNAQSRHPGDRGQAWENISRRQCSTKGPS